MPKCALYINKQEACVTKFSFDIYLLNSELEEQVCQYDI